MKGGRFFLNNSKLNQNELFNSLHSLLFKVEITRTLRVVNKCGPNHFIGLLDLRTPNYYKRTLKGQKFVKKFNKSKISNFWTVFVNGTDELIYHFETSRKNTPPFWMILEGKKEMYLKNSNKMEWPLKKTPLNYWSKRKQRWAYLPWK